MIGKYDEAIAMVSSAAPLNPLYDDVARLRMGALATCARLRPR